MDYSGLGIGNKINMVRMEDSLGIKTKPKQYVSQLLDIDVEKKIGKISMPIENKVIVPLELGDIYKIVIYTSKGLYQCMSKILKRYKENSLYVLDIQFVGKLEKYQRRQYYRLICDMTVAHRPQSEKEVRLQDKLVADDFQSPEEKQECIDELSNMVFEWENGRVVDISGGGIKFNSPVKYENDDIIVLKITAAGLSGEECIVNLRVIQSAKKESPSGRMFEIRGEFVDINNVMRENLIKYIFEEQRRIIKKTY
ncbi:MAG: flagellar brake protein [Lachnospiraceae bacterium]|nr:flagellar brake protein [Lachnospiraceae bacterium]